MTVLWCEMVPRMKKSSLSWQQSSVLTQILTFTADGLKKFCDVKLCYSFPKNILHHCVIYWELYNYAKHNESLFCAWQ